MRTTNNEPLSSQMKRKSLEPKLKKEKEYDGDFGTVISTGSTLLDLAISGGRVRGGGLPGGILVEAFGPASSGKTVLLSEIAGSVQRKGGEIMFADPESRLNRQFAEMFGLALKDENYSIPNTVVEVFTAIRKWKPESEVKKRKVIHGAFADSLAALSSDLEMDKDEGDKMGMKRAKDFSEQLRKTCRLITLNNYLVVCSNQVRENVGASEYQPKTTTPGGKAIGFYASLRLQFTNPKKIKLEKKIAGKDRERTIGVETIIEVFKSSIWKPFRSAPVTIIFDYGIDDIRQNLQYIKDYTINKVFTLEGQSLSNERDKAISIIEEGGLERKLKNEVINLWEVVESKFETNRKPRH